MRILLILLCLLPAAASAAGTDALKVFLTQTQTVKARFAQMVLDKNLKPLQQAQGVMQFSRPGKFRWDYQKPYEQVIVGDGSKLWIYDKDLNQVTVRTLGGAPLPLSARSRETVSGDLDIGAALWIRRFRCGPSGSCRARR